MDIKITVTEEEFSLINETATKYNISIEQVVKEQTISHLQRFKDNEINNNLANYINNASIQDKEIIYNNIKALETSGTITLNKEIATDGSTETL